MIGPVLTVPGECNGRWKHTFVGMARATQQARSDDVTQSKYSLSGQQDLVAKRFPLPSVNIWSKSTLCSILYKCKVCLSLFGV